MKRLDFVKVHTRSASNYKLMPSLLENDDIVGTDDDDLQSCLDDPSLVSLMRVDSADLNMSVNLDAVRLNMLQSLSASPSTCLQDKILMDSLPLASKLLIQSIDETEKALASNSNVDVLTKLTLWQNSLEPWHEFLKHVKNLETVLSLSIRCLLESLPDIIQTVFSHCKRSESLYGQKFNDLLPQLTILFRQTNIVLDLYFLILETTVKFDEENADKNILEIVLNKIGDIAVLTCGMDLKSLVNIWKAFAKLAAVHDSLIKKFDLTECITRRFKDVAKDIQTLLHDSFRDKKKLNYERTIKCAGMLLKILGRLCTFYRGYCCENKVSSSLVQLLTNLYRYSPPFPGERFVGVHSKITECSETHIVPTTIELLNTLVEDKEFGKAFFEYGKLEQSEPICYHFLTLRIIEELIKQQQLDLSSWLHIDGNIIETVLASVNDCSGDLLVNDLRISIRCEISGGKSQNLEIYDATLQLLCSFVGQISAKEFEAVEKVLLRHLLSGDFWSSLLCCDLWTYLGSITSSESCHELVSFLSKIQENLITRDKSFEFEILSNLIRRLYKLLPEDMKDSVIKDLGDYSNRRLLDPFRELLPARTKQYLLRHPSIDMTSNLAQIFQDLRRSPSVKNWTRLTSLLKSIGAIAIPNDKRVCIATLRSIWNFNAASILKTQGINREMLLELTVHLLNCPQPDSAKNVNNDRLIALIYKNMMEITEHVPIEHRIRMNVFLRDNLDLYTNECSNLIFSAITELFCSLVNDENPWVRQESFETYSEHILNGPSSDLFDNLSVGMSKLPRIRQQVSSYISNNQIHAFTHFKSLEVYLRDLAKISEHNSNWHKCYEPDYRQRDEKMPRIESANLNERVSRICDDLQNIVTKKNELDSSSIERLRGLLLQLLEP